MTNRIAVTLCTTCNVELTPETASPREIITRSGYCRTCIKVNREVARRASRRVALIPSPAVEWNLPQADKLLSKKLSDSQVSTAARQTVTE
jgi:hypothetical protein